MDNKGKGHNTEGRVEKNSSRPGENNKSHGKKSERDFRDQDTKDKVKNILNK